MQVSLFAKIQNLGCSYENANIESSAS